VEAGRRVVTPRHSERADPRQPSREGPLTLSKALQGTGVVPAHYAVMWLLRCSHALSCSCRHEVGKYAYCWYCGEWVQITGQEVTQYDTKGRALYRGRHTGSSPTEDTQAD
jgi:hypothetical protein